MARWRDPEHSRGNLPGAEFARRERIVEVIEPRPPYDAEAELERQRDLKPGRFHTPKPPAARASFHRPSMRRI